MDYNSKNLNGTSLSDIAPNNYQQQMVNNNNNMNTQMMNNSINNDDKYDNNYNKNNNSVSEQFSNQLYNNEDHIKDITKEILNGLTENNISLHDNSSEYFTTKKNKKTIKTLETDLDSKTEETKNFLNNLLKSEKIKDMIIIFILFFLMSQDMIKDLFSQYFTSIQPDNNGVVGAKGVIIYGVILAVLFTIVKNFIN